MHLFQLPVTEVRSLDCRFFLGRSRFVAQRGRSNFRGFRERSAPRQSVLGFPRPSCSSLQLPDAECGCRRNSVFVDHEEMLDFLFQARVLLFGCVRVCREQMFIPPGLLLVISWLIVWDDAEN